jgi:hypothetical protein
MEVGMAARVPRCFEYGHEEILKNLLKVTD